MVGRALTLPLSSIAWKFSVGESGISLDSSHPTGTARFARRSLRKLTGDTPLERCLIDIGRIMREDFRRAFAEAGPGWPSLQPSTVRRKMEQGFPRRGKGGRSLPRLRQINASGANAILIAEGKLRDSYGVKGAEGHVEEVNVSDGSVRVGSALSYAGAHQGGAILRKKQGSGGKMSTLKRVLSGGKMGGVKRSVSTKTGMGVLPRRPVLVSAQAHRRIKDRIEEYLAEIAAAVGT